MRSSMSMGVSTKVSAAASAKGLVFETRATAGFSIFQSLSTLLTRALAYRGESINAVRTSDFGLRPISSHQCSHGKRTRPWPQCNSLPLDAV